MSALLEVDGISRSFPVEGAKEPYCVFKDIAFSIEKGQYVSVLGHSGCGKSTLLNILAGIDMASTGNICLDGKEVVGPGIDRMVVFQNFALMPWMTVYENIQLAVQAAYPDWTPEQVDERARKYLEMVNLKGAEHKYPAAMSGGMKQRCGIARAFSVQPRLMLLDEPFAQIDALTRGVIQDELVRMWQDTGATIFMVTHDVDEAILLSDRILLMSAGPHAQIKEDIMVNIPRPRTRASIIENPEYYALRNRIIKFLAEGRVVVS